MLRHAGRTYIQIGSVSPWAGLVLSDISEAKEGLLAILDQRAHVVSLYDRQSYLRRR